MLPSAISITCARARQKVGELQGFAGTNLRSRLSFRVCFVLLLAAGLLATGSQTVQPANAQIGTVGGIPTRCAPNAVGTLQSPCWAPVPYDGMTPAGGVIVGETGQATFSVTRGLNDYLPDDGIPTKYTDYTWSFWSSTDKNYYENISDLYVSGCLPSSTSCTVKPFNHVHDHWVYYSVGESHTYAVSSMVSPPNPLAKLMVSAFTEQPAPRDLNPYRMKFDASAMVGPVDSNGFDWGSSVVYEWDFGHGSTSSVDGSSAFFGRQCDSIYRVCQAGKVAYHTFPAAGPYTVSLKATFTYPDIPIPKVKVVTSTASRTVAVTGVQGPEAKFRTEVVDKNAGRYRFVSESIGLSPAAVLTWKIDGKAAGAGATLDKTFTAPGPYTVRLEIADSQLTSNAESIVTVEAPKLKVTIANDDGTSNLRVAVGKKIRLRVTVSASSDGIGSLREIHLDPAVLLKPDVEAMIDLVGDPKPAIGAPFALAQGESRSFVQEVEANKDASSAQINFTSAWTALDDGDQVVKGSETASLRADVEAVTVKVTTDPPVFTLAETADGVVPKTVNVKVEITNNLSRPITNVTVDEKPTLKRWKMLPSPVPFPVSVSQPALPSKDIGQIGSKETKTITYKLMVSDDLGFEVSALVLGSDSLGGERITGLGSATVEAKPKYLLRLETRVGIPTAGLLPAGNDIWLRGEVKNATNTVKLDLGPLLPTAEGNAGLMSISSEGEPPNPRDLPPPEVWTLTENSSEKRFGIRVTTAYSEPAVAEEAPSGGTRTTLSFTPWGKVTLEDGTERELKPDDILRIGENTHRISIDDSIALPETSYALLAAAISAGVVEGVFSFVAAIPTMVKELVKLPYTILHAAVELQSQVWASFTQEEKEQFSRDVSFQAASVLVRNAEFGNRKFQEVWDQVNQETLTKLTAAQNQWETGDYASTAQMYSKFASEQIAGVVLPIAFGKLTKSTAVVNALERRSAQLQELMAPILARARAVASIPEVATSLSEIEGGVVLDLPVLETLGGIATDEARSLQSIADESNYVLTVRSRHASSIGWIKKFLAVVKPEAIKIKCVNEIDVLLGYNPEHIGSVVFKQPKAFLEAQRSGESVFQAIDRQLANQGVRPGDPRYLKALVRLESRQKEWQKYEKLYKSWDKQKWVDVGYNYKDNGITSKLRVNRPQARGFQLKAVDGTTEEYIVQLRDSGHQWRPITGDIDGVTFTHADGSALSESEHLWLLEKIRKNPLLAGQHGESGTYIKGGVGFIEDNLKGEAGIQFAPRQPIRAVKFNAKKSYWKNTNEYYLHWDGGYIHSGGRAKVPTVSPVLPALDQLIKNPEKADPAASLSPALPGGTAAEPGQFGRCRLRYGNSATSRALRMRADGTVLERLGGSWVPTTLADSCFVDGPLIDIEVLPNTLSTGNATANVSKVAVNQDVVADPRNLDPNGFQVGQQVTLDPGGSNEETATIAGFGSLIFQTPLQKSHAAGELIIVRAQAIVNPTSHQELVSDSASNVTTTTVVPLTFPGIPTIPSSATPTVASLVPVSAGTASIGSGSASTASVGSGSGGSAAQNTGSTTASSALPGNQETAVADLAAGTPTEPAPLLSSDTSIEPQVAYTGSSLWPLLVAILFLLVGCTCLIPNRWGRRHLPSNRADRS